MRLVDLHTDWLMQYAPETTVFDPALYARVPQRLGQAEGYLSAVSAAVLSCYRNADDWASQADPWRALGALITRVEAEFPGRLLIGPEDHARWRAEPAGLAWGVIGVEGFDALIRTASDLDRLPALLDRGVRLFQPVYGASSVLGGSSAKGDDRGLTDLGRAFLENLAAAASATCRPLLDLAHLNPAAAADVLSWFEADASRLDRLTPVYSHGALVHEAYDAPRAMTLANLKRLRALGGVMGFGVTPPFYTAPEALRASLEAAAAIPFHGSAGFEGLAIGTDFLGVDRTTPGLATAPDVVSWVSATFDTATAALLLHQNAERLLARAIGVAL